MAAEPDPPRLTVDLDHGEGRYHRQTLIAWWDQALLARARVLVVGGGALGNEIVKCLALLGVGTVAVVDLDHIEDSNLSRCVLFRGGDEGRPKAATLAERARELNPDVEIVGIHGDVRSVVGLGVFRGVDVVIGGLDSREARLHVNQACWKVGTPWIDGAIEGLMGVMRVFVPPDGSCYECTLTATDHAILAARRACSLLSRDEMLAGRTPTTVTSASIVAAMQVQEAVKLLHPDLGYDFAGKGVAYNGMTHDSYVVTYPHRDDCLSHDTYEVAHCSSIASSEPLSAALTQAELQLGGGTVLELEVELVDRVICDACDLARTVRRPLHELTASDARCADCGGEMRPEIFHTVSHDDQELLALRPCDLGIAPFDVLTARNGLRRSHYFLDGDTAIGPMLVALTRP